MFRRTPPHCIGVFSTALANAALHVLHYTQTSAWGYGLLVKTGVVYKLLPTNLPLSIYGDHHVSKVANALPELNVAYDSYKRIVEHPRAILWEKKVAVQKLKNDRERIFGTHRTSNVRMYLPYMVAALTSAYCLAVPSSQVYHFFKEEANIANFSAPFSLHAWYTTTTSTALSSSDSIPSALSSLWSSLVFTTGAGEVPSAATWLVTLDPTLTLAMGLTAWNLHSHLQRRKGFNNELDEWIRKLQRYNTIGWGALALGGLLGAPLSAATSLAFLSVSGGLTTASVQSTAVAVATVFPLSMGGAMEWVGPVWLGMSSVQWIKNLLLQCQPGRALLRCYEYPPEHGTYGESTAAAHPYRLLVTSEAEGNIAMEKKRMWELQKKALDYECDVRLYRMVRKVGIMGDDVSELEYEADKLERKRLVVAERKKKRKEAAAKRKGAVEGSEQDTDNPYNATSYAYQYMDQQQELLQQTRKQNLEGNEEKREERKKKKN